MGKNTFRFTAIFSLVLLLASAGFLAASPQWDPNLRPVKLVSRNANEVVLDDFRCD